jgi:acylphosphatase
MEAIREYMTVVDKQLIINLPDDFDYDEVEVVIMPKDNQNLSKFTKEIDEGSNSPISKQSHKEIFQELKSKYA